MKRRLFASIKLPEEFKKILRDELNSVKLPQKLEPRFVPEINWHITLAFIGWVENSAVPAALRALEKFGNDGRKKMEIRFEKIAFGPGTPSKRMIWATTDSATDKVLQGAHDLLRKRLEEEGIACDEGGRKYSGHLTLARFLPTNERNLPRMQRDVSFNFFADKIYLTESHLQQAGPVYEDLEKIDLLG